MPLSKKKKKMYIKLAIAGVLFLFVVGILYYFDLLTWFTPSKIQEFVSGFGVWAPILFILLYGGAVTAFVPATPLNVASGLIFGPWFGLLYAALGALLGALASYAIARYFASGFAREILKSHIENFTYYEKKLNENALTTVFILRVIPIFPYFITNYGLGLTTISFKDYLIGSVFGILPATIVYTYFGGSVATLNIWQILFSVLFILILMSFIFFLQKKEKEGEF